MSAVGPAVADVLGQDGTYWDPLWRVGVELSALERELLRCWPVRRLAFVAHAGASAIATTQSGSRLEHSLGLLALVAHFAPADNVARTAALLHDVGHLPLSHTIEGVAGLDHHTLGAARIRALADVLARHGTDAEDDLAVVDGQRRTVRSAAPGVLKLDHLDGQVRSARAHGRTRQEPPATLARLHLVHGGVSTDAATADYLIELAVAEARLHTAPLNVIPTAVVRHLADILLAEASPQRLQQVAAMTDEELWVLLITDPATCQPARALRRDPTTWRLADPLQAPEAVRGGIAFTITRLYRDLPLVHGAPVPATHPALASFPEVPCAYLLAPAH